MMVLTANAAWPAPRVAHYRAEIRSEDGRSYTVGISVTLGAEGWAKPSHTLDGEALNRIALDHPVAAGGSYQLNYTAAGGESRVRIPLAVPEIPTVAVPRTVEIEATLPPGYAIAGDRFPVFEKKDSTRYVAELANVPNHIEFEIARTGEASWRERWANPAVLSDFAVVALLAAGSIVRLLWRKERRT